MALKVSRHTWTLPEESGKIKSVRVPLRLGETAG
jgi:hypothetical protein